MSNISSLSIDNNLLAQRLQNAEKSIVFIQREHATTLATLHEEISKWQRKCSDLTFQLSFHGNIISSTHVSKSQNTVEQSDDQLRQCQEKIHNLEILLEEKDKLINDSENRLIVNDRKHALQLHEQYSKQRELRLELEQRSSFIAQLTNQLHREKQHQQNVGNRIRVGQIILPNKSTTVKTNDEPQQQQQQLPSSSVRRLSNRSSSLSNRITIDQELAKVLFIGRRPPTPPQQLQSLSTKSLDLTDEQLHKKRQRQFITHPIGHFEMNKVTSLRSSNKLSTVLPPVINKKMPTKALTTPTTTTTSTFQREGEA